MTDEEEDVCNTCEGTREVWESGQVYPNEPHVANIDSAPCPDCAMEEYNNMDNEIN